MAAVNYTVRLDESDKKEAEQVLNKLGLTLAAGFNVYVKALIRKQGIPFDVSLQTSSEEKLTTTQQNEARNFLVAMQNLRNDGFSAEDESAINDLQSGNYKPTFEGRLNA